MISWTSGLTSIMGSGSELAAGGGCCQCGTVGDDVGEHANKEIVCVERLVEGEVGEELVDAFPEGWAALESQVLRLLARMPLPGGWEKLWVP